MFARNTSTFGKFSKLTLTNEATGEYVSVIPERGATVHELYLLEDGKLRQILDRYDTDLELEANHGHKNSLLMPYPNRIKYGLYTFQNKEYRLPITKPEEGNAIHGFISESPFEQIGSNLQENSGSITLIYSYLGKNQGYPFIFTVQIIYTLSEVGFSMEIKTTNNGIGPMPIGVGWHPYILFEDLENVQLQLPPVERLLVEKLIPTGDTEPFKDFNEFKTIAKTEFDDCFKITSISDEAVVRLHSLKKASVLELWQHTGDKKYNYVQMYTPPGRKSIAVEPMTCPANSFNSRESLIVLEPAESFRVTNSIRFEKK